MRLAPLIISTGLATIMAGSLVLPSVAKAATMDPRDVTQMLARSLALDSHCNLLSASEKQDLRDLVARAEIALAGKYSVAVARQTLAKGRAEGKAAPCDAASSAQIKDLLKAGMQAIVQSSSIPAAQQSATAPVKKPDPQKTGVAAPAVEPMAKPVVSDKPATAADQPAPLTVASKKPQPPKRVAAPLVSKKQSKTALAQSASQVTTQVKVKRTVSLASYSSLAERYYVELKCHAMPLSRAQRMYNDVLAQHRAAMASDGANAVRKMLKSARSRAGSQSCS
jgi:hypothetical protein